MNYSDFGIYPKKSSGEWQQTCPKCSEGRKKKTQKCLYVNLDKKVWHCHHCGWSGGLIEKYEKPVYTIPEWKNTTDLPDKVLKWFQSRRISSQTIQKMRITSQMEFMPQLEKEVNVICFNYFFGDKLVNIKYRDASKNFKLHKGAELILYNLDAVIENDEIWITEGEIDALSLIEVGLPAISVPNGAGNNLQYLDNYTHLFEGKKIHIAVDDDMKGRELREALANRFGKDKCDFVRFEGLKDANEYLCTNGGLKLREIALKCENFPIEGVFTIRDFANELDDLYHNGLPEGAKTGIHGFDKLLSFHRGYLTTITGIPGHGKSDFLDHILIKLFMNAGWKGAYYSPENRPTQLHISKILRKITQRPWFGYERMTPEEAMTGMALLDEKFWFIKPPSGFTIDNILSKVAELKQSKGIDWFVIDAWNKLEHHYTESETKYIGQTLDKIVNFCERYDVHCFLVAHPTKIKREDSGKHQIPTLYDIAGSANFFNKTDNGITVYRDMQNDTVEIHVQKVKFSHWGEVGMQRFLYDKPTGLYIETN
jgi:twinkle protein